MPSDTRDTLAIAVEPVVILCRVEGATISGLRKFYIMDVNVAHVYMSGRTIESRSRRLSSP